MEEQLQVSAPLNLKVHTKAVTALAWSPDRIRIASGSYDRSVRIWNAVTGELTKTMVVHKKGITTLIWSLDSSILFSASLDNTIRIWHHVSDTTRNTNETSSRGHVEGLFHSYSYEDLDGDAQV